MSEQNLPVPDPTTLTTEAIMREVSHLQTLMTAADESILNRTHDMDLRWQQRYDASQKALDTALASADRAVSAALVGAEKAVTKAETAAEKRFDAVADFRDSFQSLISQQMPREEADHRMQALSEKLDDHKNMIAASVADVSSRLSVMSGRTVGMNAGWGYLTGGVALVSTLVAIFLALR